MDPPRYIHSVQPKGVPRPIPMYPLPKMHNTPPKGALTPRATKKGGRRRSRRRLTRKRT